MSKLSEIEARDAIDSGNQRSHRDRRYLLGLVKEMRKEVSRLLTITDTAEWFHDSDQVRDIARALLARLEE